MQIENVKTKFLTWKYLNMSKDLTSQHYFLFMAYCNMTSYMSTGSLKMKKIQITLMIWYRLLSSNKEHDSQFSKSLHIKMTCKVVYGHKYRDTRNCSHPYNHIKNFQTWSVLLNLSAHRTLADCLIINRHFKLFSALDFRRVTTFSDFFFFNFYLAAPGSNLGHLSRGQPHSPDVNHSLSTILTLGSLGASQRS